METLTTGKIDRLKQSLVLAGEYGEKYVHEGWEMKRSGKGKICWTSAAIPTSLVHTFDLHLFFPEIDGINAGVKGEAVKWQMIAENEGYPRDLCSYFRINFGHVFAGAGEAEGAYPAPDFLLAGRINCTTYTHAFEMLARHYNIPLFVWDGPFWDRSRSEPIPRHYEEYWINRMHELIAFLEEQTGQKFDYDRYKENIANEMEAHKRWSEILTYTQRVPSPVSDFDLCFPMLSIAWWRGKKITVDILKEVKAELDDRVAKGITALANEKHRLLLLSNPPWYLMDLIPDWFAEVNTVIASSLLTQQMLEWSDVRGEKFEEVMPSLVYQDLNLNIAERVVWAEGLVRDFKCDCAALMDNRGCKIIAFPVPELVAELQGRLKVPCFRFDGNMCDPRDFNEQTVRAQFETFIELLEQR